MCPELSPIAPNLSAPVRNGPFLSEIVTNTFKIFPSTNSFARWHLTCYMYTPVMPKSTPYLYRDTLEKLAAEPPTTKSALLYSLLSEIEMALNRAYPRRGAGKATTSTSCPPNKPRAAWNTIP